MLDIPLDPDVEHPFPLLRVRRRIIIDEDPSESRSFPQYPRHLLDHPLHARYAQTRPRYNQHIHLAFLFILPAQSLQIPLDDFADEVTLRVFLSV